MQMNWLWTGEKSQFPLELAVKQMIGIALKSSRAADYIEQLMELEESFQESLQAIVEDCLASIDDGTSGRTSISASSDNQITLDNTHNDSFRSRETITENDDEALDKVGVMARPIQSMEQELHTFDCSVTTTQKTLKQSSSFKMEKGKETKSTLSSVQWEMSEKSHFNDHAEQIAFMTE